MSEFDDDDEEQRKLQNEIYKRLELKEKGKGKGEGESSKRSKRGESNSNNRNEREEDEEEEEEQQRPVMTNEEYKVMENIDWIGKSYLNRDIKQLNLNVNNLTIDETDIPLISSELRAVFIYIQKERRIKVLVEEMPIKIENFSTVTFPNGVMGLFGGHDPHGNGSYSKCYYFLPSAKKFLPFKNKMMEERSSSAAVLLKDGRVLIIGGFDISRHKRFSSCEIFDPKTEKFTLLQPKMQHERAEAAAVLMGDGTVLIFGGYEGEYSYLNTIERYDPVSNTFTPVGEMLEKRAGHSATLLLNGKILICGGRGSFDTEIYDPKNNRSIEGPNMQKVRDRHSASLIVRPKTDEIIPRNFESQLSGYEVLLFGGDFRRRRVTSEIYDPVKMKFNIGPSVTVYD